MADKLLVCDFDSTLFNVQILVKHLPQAVLAVFGGREAEGKPGITAGEFGAALRSKKYYDNAGYRLVLHLRDAYGITITQTDLEQLAGEAEALLEPGESYLYPDAPDFVHYWQQHPDVDFVIVTVNEAEYLSLKLALSQSVLKDIPTTRVESNKGEVLAQQWQSAITHRGQQYSAVLAIDDSEDQLLGFPDQPEIKLVQIHRGDRHAQPSSHGRITWVSTLADITDQFLPQIHQA